MVGVSLSVYGKTYVADPTPARLNPLKPNPIWPDSVFH